MRLNKNSERSNSPMNFSPAPLTPRGTPRSTAIRPAQPNQLVYSQARNRRFNADVMTQPPYENAVTTAPSEPSYLMGQPGSGVAAAKGIGSRDNLPLRKAAKPVNLTPVLKGDEAQRF